MWLFGLIWNGLDLDDFIQDKYIVCCLQNIPDYGDHDLSWLLLCNRHFLITYIF